MIINPGIWVGIHLRDLSESYSINTNMGGFRWFSKLIVSVLWMKEASALEGLNQVPHNIKWKENYT